MKCPARGFFRWVGNDRKLGVGDDLSPFSVLSRCGILGWDAYPDIVYKVRSLTQTKDDEWKLQ